jgi:four helix bundle protein
MDTASAKPQNFKDLLVWQRGMELATSIYEITRRFPSDERFGLVGQMRRCAVSIPSNLAEGQARHTTGEFVQFISHSEGSLAELETQLRLSVEIGYCGLADAEGTLASMEELRKMLNSLRRKLSSSR